MGARNGHCRALVISASHFPRIDAGLEFLIQVSSPGARFGNAVGWK
jgi:hypothetical protein